MPAKYSLPSSRKVLAGQKYRNKQQNHITGKKEQDFRLHTVRQPENAKQAVGW
jgi:hypothetical protein